MANFNSLWSTLIVEELIRQKCNYFCISPGSRSTPITVAVAQNPNAHANIFYDERGSAFHALGYARGTGQPAVLICTSGTAVANYLPAIIEAYQDSVPLIILTADRPPELRDTGANQTIDQVKIFGNYLNWYFELPTPDENISSQFVLTTIDQAYYKAMHSPKGPVHINCMFREPFFSKDKPVEILTNKIKKWQQSGFPFTTYSAPESRNIFHADSETVKKINRTKRGIIIAGKLDNVSDAEAVLEFANNLGWPVFADITSGLRIGNTSEVIIEHFDLLFLSESCKDSLQPEMIIQFRKRFVSKRLLKYLDDLNSENYFLIDDSPHRYDPMHIVSERIVSNISQFCESLKTHINGNIDSKWNKNIQSNNKKISDFLKNEFEMENPISEISVARIAANQIPENSGLFLASSMPIRDMDMFAQKNKNLFKIAANRGASGIDGTIASAAGFANGNKSVVTLMIGDLAFIHDLNSLHQLALINYPVIMIILNNRGGGIFSFLPIAEQTEVFEKYFGTPHDLSLKDAASLFNIDYYHPLSNIEFAQNYKSAIEKQKSAIIEISVDRNENIILHKNIFKKILELLEN